MKISNFKFQISKNRKKGFSLIEVIIALAILIVTVSVFGVALSSTPLTKTTKNQNIAYHVATKKIEELRNTSFSSLPTSGAFTDPAMANLPSASGNLNVADYSGSPAIKQIIVTVTWNETGKIRSVIMETLISDGGLNKP